MAIIERGCIFGSPNGGLIERVLALHRAVCWQCHIGVMGDLGEWRKVREEMKLTMMMLEKSGR